MDRDNLVKFAHHQPLVRVREERWEGLCEGRVRKLSDRVSMPGDHFSQVRAESFSVGGTAEPGGLYAAFAHMLVCPVNRVSYTLALGTYNCAVFTISQGWDESALNTENVTEIESANTHASTHAETSRHDSPSSAT